MTVVVVSGSNFDTRIAVTNFVSATNAPTVLVDTGFFRVDAPVQGCVVAGSSLYTDGDVTGSLVAVGQYGGGQVLIYDVTDPAAPTVHASFDTGLGAPLTGIGCISFYGQYVVVGELGGPNVVLIDMNSPASVTSVPCLDFADGGVSSIAINGVNGLLAVAAGQYTFDVLNYATPTPVPQPYILPIRPPRAGDLAGPFACDFDGSNIAIGDGAGTTAIFQVADGVLVEQPTAQGGSGLEGITSIAVMSFESVEVAAGNISSPEVTLATFESEGPAPSGGGIWLGENAGNAGGALAFYGWANLFASTNDGLGVTWYNTTNWPTATPFIVAKDANLAVGSVLTLAVAAFPTPPIKLHWPWTMLPPWLAGWLRRLLGIAG